MTNAISARIISRGASGGDAGREKHMWARVFASEAELDDTAGAPGWEITNYGVVVGFDTALNSSWNWGVAAGYSEPSAESDSPLMDHEIDITGFQLATYLDWTASNDMFVELIGLVGFNENDSTRNINFAGITRKAEGDYDSWYARLYGAVGYTFELGEKFTLSPVAQFGYTYVDEDSYVETGAGAFNLSVQDNDAESLIIGVEGRASYLIGDNGSQLTGFLGAGYDTQTDEAILGASFVDGGPVFKTITEEPDDLVIRVGVGVDWVANDRIDVQVQYRYEGRDDFTNQLLTATLRWAL